MPTIEIISLDCPTVADLPVFDSFAYWTENRLESHGARFQSEFDETSGIILHLGNKRFQTDLERGKVGMWFAGDLIEWGEKEVTIPVIDPTSDEDQWWGEGQEYVFRFLPQVITDLRQLLVLLLDYSSRRQVWLSTDYQFGPSKAVQPSAYTMEMLFEVHENWGLRWNTLYRIVQA